MAVTDTCIRFFVWARSKGVSFNNTLTLGHLENMVSKKVVNDLSTENPGLIEPSLINWSDKYADSIFTALGASGIESLDYSDFEKAGIIHDLNQPLPSSLLNKYSTVVDGGTLEHVFNFPQAIRNCMQALQLNGHFLGFSPANNLMGHGLYQFSPELFYRVFSAENGFKIKGIFLVAADFSVDTETWYLVTDPAEVKDRVTLQNILPSYLMVLAEKISETSTPGKVIQSDYQSRWEQGSTGNEAREKAKRSILKRIQQRIFPIPKEENLEEIEPSFFKKTKAGK